MWVSKRKTKQAKSVYIKKLLILSGCTAVTIVVFGLGIFVYFTYFFSSQLIRPIPQQVLAAGVNEEAQSVEELNVKLEQLDIATEEVRRTADGNYVIKVSDNGEVMLSQSKNMTAQLTSLQVILSRLTMEGKRFVKLDLRFDKPVIAFQ